MATAKATGARRRGEIEKLPSGSLRVRVYAGIDPVTGKKYHLTEIVPPGPRAAKEAEKARTRLLAQVDEKRSPRTRATVNQLLDRHLEMLSVEATTLDSCETFIRNHIRPLIGETPVARVDGKILDSFYKQLRTCRSHCRGKGFVEHRTSGEHECDKLPVNARCAGDGSVATRSSWPSRLRPRSPIRGRRPKSISSAAERITLRRRRRR